MTAARPTNQIVAALAKLVAEIVAAGGTTLIPESDPLLATPAFVEAVLGRMAPHATLAYGQPLTVPGFHVVATDTDHWGENLAGLGACGAHVFIGDIGDSPQQGHPMLPTLQIAGPASHGQLSSEDIDLMLEGDAADSLEKLRELLLATLRRDYTPVSTAGGFVDFQLSRGLLGVTT
jgi:hypothetical protein